MANTIYALLEVVTNPFGLSAIGWLILSLISLGMMIVGIVRGYTPRAWSLGLLFAGLAYAVVNVCVFVVTILMDTFAIFSLAYIISVAIVAPALVLITLIFVARRNKQLGWLSSLGFALWIGCVAFAHLIVIAAAAAGV